MDNVTENPRQNVEVKAWHILLDDCTYRLEQPEDYHATLLQRADELWVRGVVDSALWQDLKLLADTAYSHAIEGAGK